MKLIKTVCVLVLLFFVDELLVAAQAPEKQSALKSLNSSQELKNSLRKAVSVRLSQEESNRKENSNLLYYLFPGQTGVSSWKEREDVVRTGGSVNHSDCP